ncbi:MAG: transcription antitermination factor NusB [Dehalococcoidia bacterium]|nr:transcription antitermination factor NusB [Dehalococcoidia bacterium]
MIKPRHKAREIALQTLYEYDTTTHTTIAVLERAFTENILDEETIQFATELVNGVNSHRTEIDTVIHSHAASWPLDQIATIDRNILRLAIYELLHNNKVPVQVAINEAVELAKDFGADSSPRFINGVLRTISRLTTRENLEN